MDHGGWALRLEDGAVTGPVVDERGVLYLGSNDGARCFLAADAESGEILWTYHGAQPDGRVARLAASRRSGTRADSTRR